MQSKSTAWRPIQQRWVLLVLPLPVTAALTALLWYAGVLGDDESTIKGQRGSAFNTELPPAAASKDSNWTKLNFYEQAAKDSARLQSLIKDDPYYQREMRGLEDMSFDSVMLNLSPHRVNNSLGYDPYPATGTEANDQRIEKKISELNQLIHSSSSSNAPRQQRDQIILDKGGHYTGGVGEGRKVDPESQYPEDTVSGEDPELKQMSGMLDKILDIQHPDRITQRSKSPVSSAPFKVHPTRMERTHETVTLLEPQHVNGSRRNNPLTSETANSFYSLSNSADRSASDANLVPAFVPETQQLVNGSTIKLQLASDLFVANVIIPAGHLVYGKIALDGDRLNTSISTIRYRNTMFQVKMALVDIDGLTGVYVPGSIARDAGKQSAEQVIQGLSIASLDPTMGAQAAGLGIEAAKTLLAKKTRQIKVTLKSGYRVWLKDETEYK